MRKKLRLYLIGKRKSLCQGCKKRLEKKELCVHHKDLNKKNNIFHNLIVLCRHCHARAHYYTKLRYFEDKELEDAENKYRHEKDEKEKGFLLVVIKLLMESLENQRNTSPQVISILTR